MRTVKTIHSEKTALILRCSWDEFWDPSLLVPEKGLFSEANHKQVTSRFFSLCMKEITTVAVTKR